MLPAAAAYAKRAPVRPESRLAESCGEPSSFAGSGGEGHGRGAEGGELMEAGTPQAVRLEDLHVPGQLSGRKHILSILVENKPGVLARIAGLFSRRGFNIVSLAVSPTEDDRFSRTTIVVDAESAPLEQVVKQLKKKIQEEHRKTGKECFASVPVFLGSHSTLLALLTSPETNTASMTVIGGSPFEHARSGLPGGTSIARKTAPGS